MQGVGYNKEPAISFGFGFHAACSLVGEDRDEANKLHKIWINCCFYTWYGRTSDFWWEWKAWALIQSGVEGDASLLLGNGSSQRTGPARAKGRCVDRELSSGQKEKDLWSPETSWADSGAVGPEQSEILWKGQKAGLQGQARARSLGALQVM